MQHKPCPLCQLCHSLELLVKPDGKTYWDCPDCGSIFLGEDQHLTEQQEEAHYLTHNNDVTDSRYQKFVSPLVELILRNVPAPAEGLDFGAGPGPVASVLLRQHGYHTTLFDPFFESAPDALERSYDFVFASEVIEHFRSPRREFLRIKELLRPQGVFFAMTEVYRDEIPFGPWHYHRDPTHVVFYRERTFAYIREMLGFKRLEFSGPRVIALFS